MDKRYRLFLFLLCTGFLLYACSAQPPVLSTSTDAPTSTSKPVLDPTSTTLRAVSTTTPAIIRSPTIRKTSTAIARQPTTAPTLTATEELFDLTEIPLTVIAATTPKIEEFMSPDRDWLVRHLAYPCTPLGAGRLEPVSVELLQLVKRPSGEPTELAKQTNFCGGLGASGLSVVYWSPSSRYVYYTDAAQGVPDGVSCAWNRGLFRAEVESGQIESISEGTLNPDGHIMAISTGKRVILYDLDQGPIDNLPSPAPDLFLWMPRWSNKGDYLIASLTEESCYPTGSMSLALFNLEQNTASVVYKDAQEFQWSLIPGDKISIKTSTGIYTYDLQEEVLIPPATSTP